MARARVALLCASGALALACVLAAVASAAPPTTIAEGGEGAGKVGLPIGVDVDQASGALYVAEYNNRRISKFAADGEFLLAWGAGVADGTSFELQVCGPATPTPRCFKGDNSGNGPGVIAPEAVAVEQASGDVYVVDRIRRRVSKFGPEGEFLWMVGKEVNQTKVQEREEQEEDAEPVTVTPEEENSCTAEDVADGEQCDRGGAGSGPNEFTSPTSLALSPSGNIWIGDTERLQEMEPDGAPGEEIALPGAGATKALGIDSAGDFYVLSASSTGVGKLHPDGTPYGAPYPLDAGGQPRALTVDGEDNVFVGDNTVPYRLLKYDDSGELVTQFGAGQVIFDPDINQGPLGNALAVDDDTKVLYAASSVSAELFSVVQASPIPEPGPLIEDPRAEDVLPSTATLAASLNPEGHATEYFFEYGTDETYGESTPKTPLPATGFDREDVFAEIDGLVPDTAYHFRLVAENECEPGEECVAEGEDTTFTTPTVVEIEAQWATEVAARSATLRARIDPLHDPEADPLGQPAAWWVEYGEGETLDRFTPEVTIPSSAALLEPAVALSGLEPATTYSYRFAARGNRSGTAYEVRGETRELRTQPSGLGFSLPDDRAWEMVSPAVKHGGEVNVRSSGDGQSQAAASGDAVAYLSRGSLEPNPEGNRGVDESSVLARRSPGGSWASKDITPPHTQIVAYSEGKGLEYKLFGPELGRALLEPRDGAQTRLVPEASEQTPYLRANAEPPAYEPLLSAANALPGFGREAHVVSSSADLSHVVLKSDVPLIEGAAIGALYAWSEDEPASESLQAVSELAGGEVVSAEAGSGSGGSSPSVRHAISEDGARAFWTPSFVDGLYLRDLVREETLRLDQVKGGFGTGGSAPLFQGADAAGTVALFTDSRELTADASEGGRDLYRCEIEVVGEELSCALDNLSGPEVRPGEGARVLGLLPGMSEDAERAYLVARGVLAESANSEGDTAVPDAPNLYAWSEGEGTRFVATLSEDDDHDWGRPQLRTYQVSAAASPSGRYLAFMSKLPLTGYDNRDASSGEAAQEVFRYDAEANGGEGELTCVSCDPSGARPEALVPGEAPLSLEFDPQGLWSGEAVAALVPEATKITSQGESLYRPRAIHDNGRVFFNAADSLVPADSNGNGDVYEYEPLGLGSCASSSGGAGVARIEGGCVALLSSGGPGGTSAFLDASQGGDDAFFYTRAKLAVTDEDAATDVYDARVGGVEARLPVSAECQGEACQPPAALPEAPLPASSVFLGPGNLAASRGRCARPARRAKQISAKAKRLRRGAARTARANRRAKAQRMRRNARRLAHRAKRASKGAKRCRARARASRRSAR